MKNLILMLFLGCLLTLQPSFIQASTAQQTDTSQVIQTPTVSQDVPAVKSEGFFNKIINSIKEDGIIILIGLVGGFFAKKGWIVTLKKWLGYGIKVSQSLSHLLASTSNGLSAVNNAIQDNGKLKENSLAEMIAAKKEFTVDLNDALLTIKPKPAAL